MTAIDVGSALGELERATSLSVSRFEDGPPLVGRVAVLPSAFNPPTEAHMELLGLGRTVAGVESIAALLTTRNVDKGLLGASLEHRVGMLLAVSEGGAGCAVLAVNAARIADQARALRCAYGAADFQFVVGYDTLVRLFDRRYYDNMDADLDELFAHHRVIAANRGDVTISGVGEFLDRDQIARRYRERITVAELRGRPARLSSTGAREAAARGGQLTGVPGEVADYISRYGLYREQSALNR